MKVVLLFVLCLFSVTDNSCGHEGQFNGGEPRVSTTPAGPRVEEAYNPAAPCKPFAVYIYEDASGSVDAAHARAAKQSLVENLRQSRTNCVSSIRFVRFGVGSVWSTSAKVFDLPVSPHCPPEPDYNQLPAAVRNFEPWREKLRQEHLKRCAEEARDHRRSYEIAVAALEGGVLSDDPRASNNCTSFANLLERVRVDIADDPTGRIVILSDLKWTCEEQTPAPVAARGVIVHVVGEQTDDKYKYSPELAERLKKALPQCDIIPEVKVSGALKTLMSLPDEQIIARR